MKGIHELGYAIVNKEFTFMLQIANHFCIEKYEKFIHQVQRKLQTL